MRYKRFRPSQKEHRQNVLIQIFSHVLEGDDRD